MKKSIFVLLIMALSALLAMPALADQKGHERGKRESSQERRDDHGRSPGRDNQRYDSRDRERDYDYRKPEHRPHGYRNQPYGRHFDHPHMHKGHEFRYDGHWNSYEAWERYRRSNPARFHQGSYYRESGHLFFRFCDPAGAACFFFSIGR